MKGLCVVILDCAAMLMLANQATACSSYDSRQIMTTAYNVAVPEVAISTVHVPPCVAPSAIVLIPTPPPCAVHLVVVEPNGPIRRFVEAVRDRQPLRRCLCFLGRVFGRR
jgi:hypothetical protein